MINLQANRVAIGPKAPPTGNARCPYHADKKPSLSIRLGEDDKPLAQATPAASNRPSLTKCDGPLAYCASQVVTPNRRRS
jgi:hypothetical protein